MFTCGELGCCVSLNKCGLLSNKHNGMASIEFACPV